MDFKKLLIVVGIEQFHFDDTLLLSTLMRCHNSIFPCCVLLCLREHSMAPKIIDTEDWFTNFNNLQFFKMFRMEKETFEKLIGVIVKEDVNKVLSKKYSGGHYPIDIRSQIPVFLWYMGTQDTLANIGNRFKISPSTVMDIINKILYFLLQLKRIYIKFPQAEEEFQDISRGFSHYPGAIGAVDGTHIFIKVEEHQQDSYIDRYRRHSINLMAVCDAFKLFTYVFVGFPGSAHDARVLKNSALVRNIERFGANHAFLDDDRFHLIGDSAFGIGKWLMTPYGGNNLTRRERKHNFSLSSDRVVIEHCFGALKGRCRRLQYINTYNICKTAEIATAACILHNFCIINDDIWTEYFYDDQPILQEEQVADQREGQWKRNHIADYLYNV